MIASGHANFCAIEDDHKDGHDSCEEAVRTWLPQDAAEIPSSRAPELIGLRCATYLANARARAALTSSECGACRDWMLAIIRKRLFLNIGRDAALLGHSA
jgi:hypothetical protein